MRTKLKIALKAALRRFGGCKRFLRRFAQVFQRKVPVYIEVHTGEELKGRNILIVGGAGGIGRAMTRVFVANGAHVVIAGRNADKLQAVSEEIGASVEWFRTDVTNAELFQQDFNNFISKKDRQSFKLDTFVFCAGVSSGWLFREITTRDFDITMEACLKGAYFSAQIIASYMTDNSIQGNILLISSSSGARPAVTPYMLSKWGMNGLVKGLAKILIPKGIVVNGIAPGPTAAGMLADVSRGDLSLVPVPSGRYSTPEEVAMLSMTLISKYARQVVGDVLYVTGGSAVITYDDMPYEY